MKAHSLTGQVLLHFPSVFFLLLLVATVFIFPGEERLPPIDNEVRAEGIVWSRYTEAGEVVRLAAPLMVRRVDGRVEVEQVRIDTRQRGYAVYLQGARGATDSQYQQIRLQDTVGEIINNGERISLSLASAVYDLDGSQRLQGSGVVIRKGENEFSGERLLWDNEHLRLQGRVRASYR